MKFNMINCSQFNSHQSVLLNESISLLNINPEGIYIDGTFGEGGHSKLILSKLTKHGRLIAMDRDWNAIKIANIVAAKDKRLTVIHSTFSCMSQHIQSMGLTGLIDGILLDLGLCSAQINNADRGFSFMQDGPLDMRMDNSIGITAAAWLEKASKKNIAWVLKTFGEERFAKNIAKAIVQKRKYMSISRSFVLSKLIQGVIPYKTSSTNRKHPATRSFLAIRMYLNQELEEITKILKDILLMLSERGRLVVISFNSLEDRIVKNFIKNQNCSLFLPSAKLPLTDDEIRRRYKKNKYQLANICKLKPSNQEIKNNICARSALLRCAEKIVFCK